MSSTKISDYFGVGTHASRPASPVVPSGCGACYWETDTLNLFVWDGSSWHQAVSAVTAPTFVQMASSAGTNLNSGITFSSTPTNGNLLVAVCVSNLQTPGLPSQLGTGWILVATLGTVNTTGDYGTVAIKWAGAGESTNQIPMASTGPGGQAVYEYSGARGIQFVGMTRGQTGTSISDTVVTKKDSTAVCGIFVTYQDTVVPTTITGATADAAATGGIGTNKRGAAPFHAGVTLASSNTVTASGYSISETVTDVWAVVV